jgi:hypothetical protein
MTLPAATRCNRRGDPDTVSVRDSLADGGRRVLAVPLGEGKQFTDLALVEAARARTDQHTGV